MFSHTLTFRDRRVLTDTASNFEEKVPKKDYPDYYKMIKKPTSISDVRVLIEKDVVRDWDALAKEVRARESDGMLLFSTHITARLRYIVRFFSQELFDQPIDLTTDADVFRAYTGPRINYSELEFENCFGLLKGY